MTKGNMSTPSINKSAPFLLKPVGKDYIWGGTRLNDIFLKNIDIYPLAETWECSTHKEGISIVASGEYEGMLFSEVLDMNPQYLGDNYRFNREFPILIKLIDAKCDLSIQVHPDDEYAKQNENGQLGKNEMWYVLEAEEDTTIINGLNMNVTRDVLRKSIESDSVERHLKKIRIKKDDVIFIEAGTIHAIGAGALIAEIQQNSNVTYRLYDYNRVDKNGKKRELHIDKAIDVANLNCGLNSPYKMQLIKFKRGYSSELLCRCKYFQVERIKLYTETCNNMVDFRAETSSFKVLLCIEGCGVIYGEGLVVKFYKGDCIFVPANSMDLKICGNAQLLNVSC